MGSKSNIVKIATGIILCFFVVSGCGTSSEEKIITKKKPKVVPRFYPATGSVENFTKHQIVYVPVYSHVYSSDEKYERLGITLSLRNTDGTQNLLIEKILYYSTEGNLIESYIDTPHILKPMASIDFIVDLNVEV